MTVAPYGRLRRLWRQVAHANQVVSGHREQHLESDPVGAPKLGLAYGADGLTPGLA